MSGKHYRQHVLVGTMNNYPPTTPLEQATLTTSVALEQKLDATSQLQAFSLLNLEEMF